MNNSYIQPLMRTLLVGVTGIICQSNGAKYDPTEEVTGITWDED